MARFPTARGARPARGSLPSLARPVLGQPAFGAPIAQAASVAFELADRRDLEAQTSEAAKQLAQANADWQATVLDRRGRAPADGAGHAAQLAADFEAFKAERLELAPPRARGYVDRGLAQLSGRTQQQALQFEAEQSLRKRVTDLTESIELSQNTVATDPGSLAETTAQVTAAIQAQSGLPAATREALVKEAREKLAASALTARIERDPAAVKAELTAGKWDEVLPPPARARLESQARGEVERRAAKARSLARQAASDARMQRNQDLAVLTQQADTFALNLVTKGAPEEGSFSEFAEEATRLERPDLAARYRHLAEHQKELEAVAAMPVAEQKLILASLVGGDAAAVVRSAVAEREAREEAKRAAAKAKSDAAKAQAAAQAKAQAKAAKAAADAAKAQAKAAQEAAELEAERLLADVTTALDAGAPPGVVVTPLGQAFAKAQQAGDARLADQVQRVADRTLAQIQASGLPAAEAEALAVEVRRASASTFNPLSFVLAEELERAVQANEKGLAEDPLAWSVQREGLRGGTLPAPPPIDWRGAGLAQRIQDRRALASALAQQEGLAEGRILPFYTQELTELTRGMADASPEQQVAVLRQLSALSPAQQQAVSERIATDSAGGPILAAATALSSGDPADRVVALQILKGAKIRTDDPKITPRGEDLQLAANDYFGGALVAMPAAQPALLDAALAVYAAKAAAVGDRSGEIDEDRLYAALGEVTGGVIAFNGRRIVAPWRGADDGDVEAALGRLTPAAVGGPIRTRDGSIMPLGELAEEATLVSVGQGRFEVLVGGYQVVDPRAPGRPLVLDLAAMRPQP